MTRWIRCAAAAASVLAGASCGPANSVQQHGSMREVLRNGHTQPRIRLGDVTAKPGAIGVGALAGLAGEVTIVNGEVWVARSSGDGASVTGPDCRPDDYATLLAVAHVDAWTSVPLGDAGGTLGARVGRAASGAGVDTSQPFPFIVEGDITELEAHVIAGSCPIANPDGELPWRFSVSSPTRGRLVGFYAEDSEGVMTHHGDLTHTHVIMDRHGERITAHADHVDVASGAVLHVPAP